MLGNYAGYIVPLGFGLLVLDELILLAALLFMFLNMVVARTISVKIGGYGAYILIFLFIIIALTLVGMVRPHSSIEIISRDRWIILNALTVLLPFVYKPSMTDLTIFSQHYVRFMVFLTLSKLAYLVVNGPNTQFAQFSPDFLFMLGISLVFYLFSDEAIFNKMIFTFVALIVSILGEQISAILFILVCALTPIYLMISNARTRLFPLFSISVSLLVLLFVVAYFPQIIALLKLNPLNFTIIDKLMVYSDIWSEPFVNITPMELFFGKGPGYIMNVSIHNEFSGGYSNVRHSLAHNFLVTLFVKFGLLGLSSFLLVIALLVLPGSKRFNFNNSALLKITLLLILFNFLSTPGIWKIRKAVFFWFIVGVLYFFRVSCVNSKWYESSKQLLR